MNNDASLYEQATELRRKEDERLVRCTFCQYIDAQREPNLDGMNRCGHPAASHYVIGLSRIECTKKNFEEDCPYA